MGDPRLNPFALLGAHALLRGALNEEEIRTLAASIHRLAGRDVCYQARETD